MLDAAERHLPPGGVAADAELARRARTAILISWLGIGFTTASAVLYAVLGSPWSAAAIAMIAVSLLMVPRGIERGMSLSGVGNGVTAVTWLATFIVGARTGGFSSPAVVWSFFHPITTYVACGRRWASIWSLLSAFQIAVFYVADSANLWITDDLSAGSASLLRALGFIGCILANAAVIAGIEGVRQASQDALDRANRMLDRQRILDDMHDGVGSQLLGLMIQVRAKRIDDQRLVQSLESCLDDLKLIVDSLDPADRTLATALAELRARVEPRCAASGVELRWAVDPPSAPPLPPDRALQVLRALQEMTSNALRHSASPIIDVELQWPNRVGDDAVVAVRDHGRGFDPAEPPRIGRGLASLRARAQRLGGRLTITPAAPGTRVAITFPV